MLPPAAKPMGCTARGRGTGRCDSTASVLALRLNAALFERARFHDFWAVYQDDVWTERPADGFMVAPSVRLMATPGHTAQDITTLVTTAEGLAACTHLWWSSQGPAVDPLAEDQKLLEPSRARLLALEPAVIIPGHGTPFPPSGLAPAVS